MAAVGLNCPPTSFRPLVCGWVRDVHRGAEFESCGLYLLLLIMVVKGTVHVGGVEAEAGVRK
jgi:hypothetical protein